MITSVFCRMTMQILKLETNNTSIVYLWGNKFQTQKNSKDQTKFDRYLLNS